jgi:hypothetical protein
VQLRRRLQQLIIGAAAGLAGTLALAHHSTVMFEWGHEKLLEGTILSFEWTQPHSWIRINVPGKDGAPEEWGLEGMSPSWLGRHGWTRNSIKAGDQVKIAIYPLRDGRNGGFAVRIVFADGHTLEQLPQPGS